MDEGDLQQQLEQSIVELRRAAHRSRDTERQLALNNVAQQGDKAIVPLLQMWRYED